MKRHLGSRTWLHGLHHFFRTSDIKITTFTWKNGEDMLQKSYKGPICWVGRSVSFLKKCIFYGSGPICTIYRNLHHLQGCKFLIPPGFPTREARRRGELWNRMAVANASEIGRACCRKSSSWEAGKNTDSLEISLNFLIDLRKGPPWGQKLMINC